LPLPATTSCGVRVCILSANSHKQTLLKHKAPLLTGCKRAVDHLAGFVLQFSCLVLPYQHGVVAW